MLKKMVLPPTLLSYFVSLYTKIVDQRPRMQCLQSEPVGRATCHEGEFSESEEGFRSRLMLRRGNHKRV